MDVTGFSRMLQDAVECHGIQQDLVEYKMGSCATDAAVGSPGYWQGQDVTPAEAAVITPG